MDEGMKLQVQRAYSCCRVLLAKGDTQAKAKLKISNQDFPAAVDQAYDFLLRQAISAEVARRLMTSGRLYVEGMATEHFRECAEVLEELVAKTMVKKEGAA